ncbi:MAG: thioether cross-link-forming SCIFF peptide maturase [Firmicutes bacterium]|nr:thioether cross-link-forming SCIFF peptide maturase [Ezakiella sp.]MDD7761828.1 thioether cross-link-forming SCIFF peptide maturase [Bacillota bacterium]
MKERIHKFYLNGVYIVLDVNSGAVHIVDKIVYDIVDDYYDLSAEELERKYDYSIKDIKEAREEIEVLVKEDLLFTEPITIDLVPFKNQNIIKALCLHMAHDCNLKCEYCFASQGNFKGERALMDLETGKRALEFLCENSGNRVNLEVDFFGGEPLMNFEVIKELVKYGRELEPKYNKHFRFTCTTNGVLLSGEVMDFLNENMDNVVLSLDGRRSVNDKMRKTLTDKGSYDIITPKFQEFVKKRGDKDYYIRGTFTNQNLDFSKDIMDYYKLGFKKVSMEPVVTDPNEYYALRSEHLDDILREYEELSKEYIDIKKNDNEFMFFHFMIDLNQGPCIIKRASGCGAGNEYLAVTPKGELYPCHQFVGEEEFIMGNVWDGITRPDIREAFKNTNVFTKDECSSCWARFYCSGGCHANAWYQNHDINKTYKMGCEMERKRIECAISILANQEEAPDETTSDAN